MEAKKTSDQTIMNLKLNGLFYDMIRDVDPTLPIRTGCSCCHYKICVETYKFNLW